MVLHCVLKTFAFISALLSVAVLGLSLVVLISSITCGKESTKTDDVTSDHPDAKNNHTTNFLPLNSTTINKTEDNGPTTTDEPHLIASLPSNTTLLSLQNETEEERKEVSAGLSNSMSSDTTTNNTADVFPSNVNLNEDADNNDADITTTTILESMSSTTTSPSASPKRDWNSYLEYQHDFWKAQSDTYIILIQASSGTGIFAALLQLGFSWLLICGSAKGMKERKTLWNLSNFIVLILVVVIILVPLSYNSTNNTFKGASMFVKEVYRKTIFVEFSAKTLETIRSSIPNFLAEDLSLYYYVLGVDSVILLAFLIPPLVYCLFYPCKKCCCKGKLGKTESDLMLFGSGGGTSMGDLNRYS